MSAVPTRCDQCGKWDFAPKSHWFPEGTSYHHDCLPADKREQLIASSDSAKAIVEACEGGKRDDDLRSFINDLHSKEEEAE